MEHSIEREKWKKRETEGEGKKVRVLKMKDARGKASR